MQMFLVAVTLAVAASAALAVDPSIPDGITAYDYHRKVGIPKAEFMKRAETNSQSRIINGATTDVTKVPYQVGLIIRMVLIFDSVCGGTLVSSTKIITGAHCYFDGLLTAQYFTVVLGSNTLFTGGQRLTTTDVTVHPQWFPLLARNDVACLTISAISFNDFMRPIALPTGDESANSWMGQEALASGYGLTSDSSNIGLSQSISSVKLKIVDNSVCVNVYGAATISSNMCTSNENGASICSGDSGGPLAVESNGRPVLVGISSYHHRDGCELGYPNGFTRINSYLDWLNSVL